MLQLQQAGFDAIGPGSTLADAETEVSAGFSKFGVAAFQPHHTSHGIGLEGDEWPCVDTGSTDGVVEENLVLWVEPGPFVPSPTGFRHAETVVVRAAGVERLTSYPRDLASTIVPV